ncbi:unnamed protein product, partial [Brassica oleracea]
DDYPDVVGSIHSDLVAGLWLLVPIYTTLPPIYEEGSRFLIAFLTRGVRLQACQWSWSHFLPRSLIERYMY